MRDHFKDESSDDESVPIPTVGRPNDDVHQEYQPTIKQRESASEIADTQRLETLDHLWKINNISASFILRMAFGSIPTIVELLEMQKRIGDEQNFKGLLSHHQQ